MHIEKILLRDVGPFEDVTIELPKGTNPDLTEPEIWLHTGGEDEVLRPTADIAVERNDLEDRVAAVTVSLA